MPKAATPLNHIATSFPWKCSRCSYSVATEEEQQQRIASAAALSLDKSPAGVKATAARVKVHCEAHDEVMEYQSIILSVEAINNIIDLLHAMDINIPQRILKFCCHDKVLWSEKKGVSSALKAYYDFIGCPFDPAGDQAWWHGAVWHYDIVLGASPRSPGLDVFILSTCLICYGVNTGVHGKASSSKATAVVDDLDDNVSRKKQKPQAGDDALGTILRRLFGHNAQNVRKIFESWTAYADCFQAVNNPWTHTSTTYNEERGRDLYWAGLRQLKAMKIMSNERCDSDYFPLVAYVASQQMALRGDLWPYSTRAVHATSALIAT